MSWVPCVVDNDYEICDEFPYPIRRIGSNAIIGESDDGHGYIKCYMNGRTFRKHRIVADQFIPNPDQLPYIDHINHDRSDYHIENLRWCTSRENNMNKSSNLGVELEYYDEIPADPEDIIEVTEYGNHEFENLYFADDIFYQWNGIQYRKLSIIMTRGVACVKAWTKNNRRVNIYYTKFKRLYNLVQ